MRLPSDNPSFFRTVTDYFRNLSDASPYWRVQAGAWGIILVVVVLGGVLFTFMALASVFGGGNVSFTGTGSPGPVVFRHYAHMTFQDGKYKDCKSCHDNLFATSRYGTYILKTLRNSPDRKYRIGKEESTLFVPTALETDEANLVTYDVPRACLSCAAGQCHDGKESFSRLECLRCHQRR